VVDYIFGKQKNVIFYFVNNRMKVRNIAYRRKGPFNFRAKKMGDGACHAPTSMFFSKKGFQSAFRF